jgi:membrane fusion protein (multidrug efflux system)
LLCKDFLFRNQPYFSSRSSSWRDVENNSNPSYQQQAPELPVEIVQQGDASVSREYAASVEGISNVEIRPQVTGYLSKIFVDEGDFVRAGQVLFKIEDQVFHEQLKSAQAALITAQANLSTSKIDLDRKRTVQKQNGFRHSGERSGSSL